MLRRAASPPGAAGPGNIEGGIGSGGFAHRQSAPDFHRGLGFLDIFEKSEFAVKAAPAAGLEQFGEIFQSLLGKRAPARDDISAARHVQSMCHEPSPQGERRRGRNPDESNQYDSDILWKTFVLSSGDPCQTAGIDEGLKKPGFSPLCTIKLHRGMAHVVR